MRKIAAVFIVLFLLPFSSTATATDANMSGGLVDSSMNSITQRVEALWASAQGDHGTTVLAISGDTNTYIGSQIPVYEAVENTFEELSYSYFPIIDNDEVVALAIVDIWNAEEMYITLSFDLASEIQSVYENNDELALVYTQEGVYIFTGNAFDCIYVNPTADLTREKLVDVLSINHNTLESVETSAISALNKLDYVGEKNRGTVAKYCMVDIIKQTGDYTCWA